MAIILDGNLEMVKFTGFSNTKVGVTGEYPATPKVTLERVDAWLRSYVATQLRGYAATRLCGYVATWLRGYMAISGYAATQLRGYVAMQLRGSHKEQGIVIQSCTSTWLRGYAATWYLRSHKATLSRITFGVAGYSLVKPESAVP